MLYHYQYFNGYLRGVYMPKRNIDSAAVRQISSSIYRHLTEYRKSSGLSVTELYTSIGISQTVWQHLRKHDRLPSMSTILLVSDALNIPIDVLVGRAQLEKPTNDTFDMKQLLNQVETLTDDQVQVLFNKIVDSRVCFKASS